MTFQSISPDMLKQLGQRLEQLSKSTFAAGYQGINTAGRTGVSALAIDNVDSVLRSIAIEQSQFMLTKDIPQLKATQSVYTYRVRTAAGTDSDLAGFEAWLPQEDQSQYIMVSEVLKMYGIRKSITQLAQLINDQNGYAIDLQKEMDETAALSMANALERDLYIGGDYYMNAAGAIDSFAAANPNGNVRQLRGIQANIREGNLSNRGIPGDFIAYGNNNSVVFDRKGGVLERAFLDQVVTAVRNSMGMVREAHCTTSQLAEFRATFFPIERADISALFAIRGPNINNDEKVGVTVDTVAGPLDFMPTVFKYTRDRPVGFGGSVGQAPLTPAAALAAGGAATGSGFQAGQVYSYRVAAQSVSGLSMASAPAQVTVTTADAANTVTITNVAGAESYQVYRSPVETNGKAGTELAIGKIIPTQGSSTTVFTDNNALIPGLNTVLMLPRDKNRAKLATIGNMLNKEELGKKGTATETIYTSYVGCVVDRPRSFAVVDNVYQRREGI